MTMMKWLAFAMTLAAGSAVAATSEPAAPLAVSNLALAQRYMAATGGIAENMREESAMVAVADGGSAMAHARQRALLKAIEEHREEIAALDAALAERMAATFSTTELSAAVTYFESPAGRSMTAKKAAYFSQEFLPHGPAPHFSEEEWAALAAYEALPEAASMRAKMPVFQVQIAELSKPVVAILRIATWVIFCHETSKCNGDTDYDQHAGPTLRGP